MFPHMRGPVGLMALASLLLLLSSGVHGIPLGERGQVTTLVSRTFTEGNAGLLDESGLGGGHRGHHEGPFFEPGPSYKGPPKKKPPPPSRELEPRSHPEANGDLFVSRDEQAEPDSRDRDNDDSQRDHGAIEPGTWHPKTPKKKNPPRGTAVARSHPEKDDDLFVSRDEEAEPDLHYRDDDDPYRHHSAIQPGGWHPKPSKKKNPPRAMAGRDQPDSDDVPGSFSASVPLGDRSTSDRRGAAHRNPPVRNDPPHIGDPHGERSTFDRRGAAHRNPPVRNDPTPALGPDPTSDPPKKKPPREFVSRGQPKTRDDSERFTSLKGRSDAGANDGKGGAGREDQASLLITPLLPPPRYTPPKKKNPPRDFETRVWHDLPLLPYHPQHPPKKTHPPKDVEARGEQEGLLEEGSLFERRGPVGGPPPNSMPIPPDDPLPSSRHTPPKSKNPPRDFEFHAWHDWPVFPFHSKKKHHPRDLEIRREQEGLPGEGESFERRGPVGGPPPNSMPIPPDDPPPILPPSRHTPPKSKNPPRDFEFHAWHDWPVFPFHSKKKHHPRDLETRREQEGLLGEGESFERRASGGRPPPDSTPMPPDDPPKKTNPPKDPPNSMPIPPDDPPKKKHPPRDLEVHVDTARENKREDAGLLSPFEAEDLVERQDPNERTRGRHQPIVRPPWRKRPPIEKETDDLGARSSDEGTPSHEGRAFEDPAYSVPPPIRPPPEGEPPKTHARRGVADESAFPLEE